VSLDPQSNLASALAQPQTTSANFILQLTQTASSHRIPESKTKTKNIK